MGQGEEACGVIAFLRRLFARASSCGRRAEVRQVVQETLPTTYAAASPDLTALPECDCPGGGESCAELANCRYRARR